MISSIIPFVQKLKALIPAIRTAQDDSGAVPTAQALEQIRLALEAIPDSENSQEDANVLEAWRV